MAVLTVFTPTYNRADMLPIAYDHLLRQTNKDFKWLIVDDGSTDNTRQIVETWILNGNLDITYIYKENGGLHTGYNTAIEKIDTELCVCIDSDDYMPNDAVEKILCLWDSVEENKAHYAGIIGLDFFSNGEGPIGGFFPDGIAEGHFLDLAYKYHHKGDTKIVCRTDLLKNVAPMPTYNGEKNFNPVYLYLIIDELFPFLYLNDNLCFVDYQDTGMAANIFNQYYNSPYSFAALRELLMGHTLVPCSIKFRNAIHYVASCCIAHDFKLLFKTRHKGKVLFAFPLGILLFLYIIWKRK